MATVTRMARKQQQQGQWQRQQLCWVKMRVVAMAMRLVGDKEGEGNMAMATVKSMVGE
jgi:hypothetical protein